MAALTLDGSQGSCFGFSVRSELALQYLRTGSGQSLTVSVANAGLQPPYGDLLMAWTATADVPFEGQLYQLGQDFRLWLPDTGWFLIDPDTRSVTLPESSNPIRREERLWGIPAILCCLARGDIPLHAAAVEIGGQAVVLAAPRSFGKTTLAAACLNAGHRLLSEDVTCVQPGRWPSVVPGPAMLRIRPDVAAQLSMAHATPVGPTDDRVHYAIDSEWRGDSQPVPLRGIFLLRGGSDESRVEVVPAADAIRDLWPLTSMFPTRSGLAGGFEALVDVVRRVPVWNLYRRLRIDELERTVDLMAKTIEPGDASTA